MLLRGGICLLLVGICCAILDRQGPAPPSVCYGDLGCFENNSPFQTWKDLPQNPATIATNYLLYTRSNRHSAQAVAALHPDRIQQTHFSGSRKTKIIVHGFSNNGHKQWIMDMKDALLDKGDFNVIAVDWGFGAGFPYDQAVANTRLVAAEISKLLEYAVAHKSLHLHDVHLIGHSLGAQTCGFVGAKTKTIGRITGLDPAEPSFTAKSTALHLDSSDAAFVDVIHTDSGPFKGLSGFGLITPMGHVDFYPNGGTHQTGCPDSVIGGIFSHLLHDISHITSSVSCSHSRAHQLFIASIHNSCQFTAVKCGNFISFDSGQCTTCGSGGCAVMGYDADKHHQRGSYYLSTTGARPFCGPKEDMALLSLEESRGEATLSDILLPKIVLQLNNVTFQPRFEPTAVRVIGIKPVTLGVGTTRLSERPVCHSYYVEVQLATKLFKKGIGAIFVTLKGSSGTTEDIRLTGGSDDFPSGTIIKHVVTSQHSVGSVQQVTVRYEIPNGFAGAGAGNFILVDGVTVRSFSHGSSAKFCMHDGKAVFGEKLVLTSHSGC